VPPPSGEVHATAIGAIVRFSKSNGALVSEELTDLNAAPTTRHG
jgi:hypothetical protein